MKPILTRFGFFVGTAANLIFMTDHVPGTGLRLALVGVNAGLLGLALFTLPTADEPRRLRRGSRQPLIHRAD